MSEQLDQLAAWMAATEDEHLELKEAKNRFDFEEFGEILLCHGQ